MRLHRFYITTPITSQKFDITDRDRVHQWRTVFRYNVGSQVILFDGLGSDYQCVITSLRNLGATVEVVEKLEDLPGQKMKLWLCAGIIKKDNFELVVQKATELGVSCIVPILCERSEKKNLNMERLRKIAIESSEQSGRRDVPVIHDIVNFSEIVTSHFLPDNKVALHLEGRYIGDFLEEKNTKDVAFFVGTEGGWSEKEMEGFAEQNIPSISLGPQVLRAETASIAVCSLLLL